MNDWQWKKRAELVKQLKHFGVKKLTFISEYAKKPRILIKAKAETGYDDERYIFGWDDPREDFIKQNIKASEVARQAQASALYQTQLDRGIQGSVLGYHQMAMVQASLGMRGASGMGQSQFGGGLGGLAALGSQLTGGRFI